MELAQPCADPQPSSTTTSTRHLVVVDVETSGLRDCDEAVEIAWHDLDTDERGSFIPRHDREWVMTFGEPTALEINGYRERLVDRPQDRGVERNRLLTALTGNSLAGSNPAFDARHLAQVLDATPWHHRLVDLAAYAAGVLGLDPRCTPGLAAVCDRLGIPAPDHTAAGDVAATAACFLALQARAQDAATRGGA